MAPLIRSLELLRGETPASYVSRLAAYHGTIPREFCSDFGMRWPFLCSGQDDQLRRLSRLTGANLRQLQFWSPGRLQSGRYRVGGAVSSVGAFRRTSIRLCPICMTEALDGPGTCAIFQLLEWCVTCLHRCEMHGVTLCALPPAANSHETYDVVAQVLRHQSLILEAANRHETLRISPFEDYIRQRILHGPLNDWLHPLELVHLHRACLTLGLTISGYPGKRLIDVDRDTERDACDAGFAVLRRGSEALAEALGQLRGRARDGRAWFSADLGLFHAWLRTVQEVPTLKSLVSTVQRHVFRNYPSKPDRPVLGALSHERLGSALRYARCTEVADLLQAIDALPLSQPFSGDLSLTTFCTVRSTALAQVIAAWRSGELNGQVMRGEGKGLQALRLSPNALCDRMERRLYSDSSLAETARYLRISLAAIRHLRDVGLLQQVRRRNADTNFLRNLISKASIRAFQRDHITLGQLAERRGVAPMHLARRLDHDGIPALETRHGMVRVYRRDVLPIGLLRGPVPDEGDGEPTPVAWVVGTDVRA